LLLLTYSLFCKDFVKNCKSTKMDFIFIGCFLVGIGQIKFFYKHFFSFSSSISDISHFDLVNLSFFLDSHEHQLREICQFG
jgi:hypothetical protein